MGPFLPKTTAASGLGLTPAPAGEDNGSLPRRASNMLPANDSQGVAQTAGSLPAHLRGETVAYAQATRLRNWTVAHAQRSAAFAARQHAPGG